MRAAPRRSYIVPLRDDRQLQLGARPLVMGILNVTPDSFADAAPGSDPAAAVVFGLVLLG